MNIGVFDKRQVTCTAGNRDIDVIFDTPGQGTVTNSQVAMASIGIERNEDDLSPLLSRDSDQLREFDIVTDQNSNTTAVGVEHFHAVPWRNAPPFSFTGSDVDFILLPESSIPAEEIGNVVKGFIFNDELRSTDDIDVIFNSEFCQQIQVLRRVFGKMPSRMAWPGYTRAGE